MAKYAVYLVIAMGVAITAYASYNLWKHRQQMIGWDKALDKVAEQNATAAKEAAKVRFTVNDCFDDGGEWNVETGICTLP